MDDSNERTVAMKGVGLRVFLRSFVIEIMWNYPRMQNIGFTFCLLPALDRLISDDVTRKEVTKRQLESGNTNPALAPMCIGAVARVEEGELSQKTPLIKKRLMSTLAAQGDRIFWGVLRPVSSLLGVSIAMTSFSYFWAPLVALLIYNVPNLVIRYMGFNAGWNDGVHVVRRFKSRWVEDSIAFLRWLVFLCSGSLTAVALILAEEHAKANDVENFVGLGLFVLVVFSTCFLILKKSFSQTRVIYPLLIIMLVGFSLLQRWT
ncbi:MAG: PTS system mannose/fructose/sorbose family transporter subunit IID [Desulfomonilaceae bacterium]